MQSSTTERWTIALAEIERHVETCEQRFLHGDDIDTPQPGAPASDLGPLPPALEARARAVLDKLHSVQSKIERVPRPQPEIGRTRFSGIRAAAVTFDRTI